MRERGLAHPSEIHGSLGRFPKLLDGPVFHLFNEIMQVQDVVEKNQRIGDQKHHGRDEEAVRVDDRIDLVEIDVVEDPKSHRQPPGC